MLDSIKKIFKDNSGNTSTMRILSIFAVVVPITAWVVYVFTNEWVDFNEAFALLALGAMGSKAAQKWAEVKETKTDNTNNKKPSFDKYIEKEKE